MEQEPNTPVRKPSRRGLITDEDRRIFAEVLDKTTRVKDASEAIDVSIPTGYKIARSLGWHSLRHPASSQQGRPQTKHSPDLKTAFFTEFERLGNVSAAARLIGVPSPTCFRWLRAAGLSIRGDMTARRDEFYRLRIAGHSRGDAAAQVGVSARTAQRWDNDEDRFMAVAPFPRGARVDYTHGMTTRLTAIRDLDRLEAQSNPRYLSLSEREEIYALRVEGISIRQIAVRLDRSPATISRELRRNAGKQGMYRAYGAHRYALRRRARPKTSKLVGPGPLREYVTTALRLGWSPQQISRRIVADHPSEPEMRVCPETIYQAIYVQSRGALKREVTHALRTGRVRRKPVRTPEQRTPRFRDSMINISERPAHVEDRVVPGHWEGDLILGAGNQSAIGTLVERATRYVLLVHLPVDHTAVSVRDGLIQAMQGLPQALRRSLTWDQGAEMALHRSFSMATNMDVYFCDPHSPWQRGSNENTNGLLRQYFPKGTELSHHGPEELERVANLLNDRPRKTLDWKTPAERMRELLSIT